MTFTPFSALLGGALIGSGASVLLITQGRVAGISGIVGGLLKPARGEVGWRLSFLVGLLVGALALAMVSPERVRGATSGTLSITTTILAGVLVGLGTQIGHGCTSGHGVCGISRGSGRSLLATLTFMTTGMIATFLVRHVLLPGAP